MKLEREKRMKSWETNNIKQEPEQPKTLCINCKHFWLTEDRAQWRDIWYSHKCMASPVKQVISTVTGKPLYEGKELYEYCRDINKGDCPKFEKKGFFK